MDGQSRLHRTVSFNVPASRHGSVYVQGVKASRRPGSAAFQAARAPAGAH